MAARGEDFRIVQVHGTLFVCSRQNGSCCCGWEEKGRMPFDHRLFADGRVFMQRDHTFTSVDFISALAEDDPVECFRFRTKAPLLAI